jgi:hypothetical protein
MLRFSSVDTSRSMRHRQRRGDHAAPLPATRPGSQGGSRSARGAAPATLAAMKKLLLLVVIVALATIATKKVRAS